MPSHVQYTAVNGLARQAVKAESRLAKKCVMSTAPALDLCTSLCHVRRNQLSGEH